MSRLLGLVLRPAQSDEEACEAILPIAEAEDSWVSSEAWNRAALTQMTACGQEHHLCLS